MWSSGFFNALLKNGEYDRRYNADAYSNALSMIVGNGIVNALNGTSFQVTAVSVTSAGYALSIKRGWAWIKGKWVHNDTDDMTGTIGDYTLNNIPMCAKNYKRIDRVFLHRDDNVSVRDIFPTLRKSTETTGTVTDTPTPVRSDSVYELCIAEIHLDYTGDTPKVTVYDKRADRTLCGWVNGYFGDNWEQYCATINNVIQNFIEGVTNEVDGFVSNKTTEFVDWFTQVREDVASVTILKPIINTVTVSTAGKTFDIGIAEYNPDLDTLEVYTNGMYEKEGEDYTIDATNKTISFTSQKVAGTVLDIIVTKMIDGRFYDDPSQTLIESVESRLTDIYARLEDNENRYIELNYECTGTDDNIAISNIVKTFLSKNLTDSARLRLNVKGNFGATTPAYAQVSTDNPEEAARWFDFGVDNTNRRFVLDFSNCSAITLPLVNNTRYVIFYGHNQEIEKCVLRAGAVTDTGTRILCTYGRGKVVHTDCRYGFIADGACDFTRHGRFENCEVTLVSKTGDATAFYVEPSAGICEVKGGIYWLYTGANSNGNTHFVYYSRASNVANNTVYAAVSLIENVCVPGYTTTTVNGVSVLPIGGQYFKQAGILFRTLANAGGYIRVKNLMSTSARLSTSSIDASTDYINEGHIPVSRAKGQQPFI